MENIFYSWKDLDQDILLLISQMKGWTPDRVIGVKRGGLVPAVKLSHILNKPLLILNCQLRDSENLDVKLLEAVSEDEKLLIIDDICDTGETFEKIHQKLKNCKEVKFCTLFNNIRQKFLTNYSARKIDRDKDKRWITFPWEI